MAGAQKQLPRQTSAETGDADIHGSTASKEAPPSSIQRPGRLTLSPSTNLFEVYSAASLLAPEDRGRAIPSLSTAPPRAAAKPPVKEASALEQFHSAMTFYSLLPFPFGSAFSVLDGAIYGAEGAVNLWNRDYSEAGLNVLGAGAGIAGVVGPQGRIPAKMAHVAATESAHLGRLIAMAKDVNCIEDRGFLIGSLGDIVKKNGPNANAAIKALEEIALRKSGEDYTVHIREAAAMLVHAETDASNKAVQNILVNSRGDNVRYHIINLLVNRPSSPSPLLKDCVLKCADDWVQDWAIQGLFTRSLDDDAAGATLKALLAEATPQHRKKILQYVYESFHNHMHLLEDGLQSFQPPSVRKEAARGMLHTMQRMSWDPLDTKAERETLHKFREEVAKNETYSDVVLEIDRVLGVTPH